MFVVILVTIVISHDMITKCQIFPARVFQSQYNLTDKVYIFI